MRGPGLAHPEPRPAAPVAGGPENIWAEAGPASSESSAKASASAGKGHPPRP